MIKKVSGYDIPGFFTIFSCFDADFCSAVDKFQSFVLLAHYSMKNELDVCN